MFSDFECSLEPEIIQKESFKKDWNLEIWSRYGDSNPDPPDSVSSSLKIG
jgi:hypothetical protein